MVNLHRPVKRKTGVLSNRRRRIVVTLYPAGVVGLREERTKTEFTIPLRAVYDMAVKIAAREHKRRK